MKIYRLTKQTYYCGMGERVDQEEIGYYSDSSKAIEEAKRLQKENASGQRSTYAVVICYPDKVNTYGRKRLYTDLSGNEVSAPYDAYVITEIEVK